MGDLFLQNLETARKKYKKQLNRSNRIEKQISALKEVEGSVLPQRLSGSKSQVTQRRKELDEAMVLAVDWGRYNEKYVEFISGGYYTLKEARARVEG